MADELGAKEVLRRIEMLSRDDAWFWQPSALLRRIAATGGTFAGLPSSLLSSGS